MMVITWDERKRLSNLDKHGLDFATLSQEFFERAATGPAKKGRLYALGRVRGDVVVVFFARLGVEGVSVISMRPPSKKERANAP
jgi:uncharacterized protein